MLDWYRESWYAKDANGLSIYNSIDNTIWGSELARIP